MKHLTKVVVCVLSLFVVSAGMNVPAQAGWKRKHKIRKNIIFMVPDGMGLSNVTAARIFKNGPNGDRLAFETLANVGYQSTHSANSTVTDSAAAASAWAVGEKFVNGEISCHGDTATGTCLNQVPTILELAEQRGMATGLVATSQISHATPAAFGAHTVSRNCGAEIARQFIANDVDVIFGGGVYGTKSGYGCENYTESWNATDKRQYIIDMALAAGYTLAVDETQMNAAVATGKKILGMFEQNGIGGGKTVEMFRLDETVLYPEGEPTLAGMTAAALKVLEKDRQGLFLMVEGSQIDWEDHANRVEGQIAETIAFDEAVKVVLDWIKEKPFRRLNTQLIVVADHDTGGFAVNGPYGTLSQAGDIVEAGWTSGSHTAVDTIIYSQGPHTWELNSAVDNTDLYYVMEKFLR